MADRGLEIMKILQAACYILYLSKYSGYYFNMGRTFHQLTPTNDTRSGTSHSPEVKNCRTFPFAAHGNAIQAIPFSMSSTKPMIRVMLGWDSLMEILSS